MNSWKTPRITCRRLRWPAAPTWASPRSSTPSPAEKNWPRSAPNRARPVRSTFFWSNPTAGYGYARRGHEERRNWAALIQKYLEETKTLRALALLIDCRIPTQQSDRLMADFAKARKLPVIAVLTKADKCSLKERSAQQKTWEAILGGQKPVVVSAVTRLGIDELWARLREAGAPDPLPSADDIDGPSAD